MHQCIGSPFLFSVESLLEQFESQRSLTQLLYHHILVRGVEVVMVLQCIVIIKVLALIEVGYGLVVIGRVYNGVVGCIILLGIAVDGKLAQTVVPLLSQVVVREQAQCGSQYVSLPAVFLCLGVARVSCRDGTSQLIVTLCLQELVYIVLLCIAQLVPLEESTVCHAHCPER